MTPSEAGALLTVAAAYDNRKPDADAAQAWALALDGYGFHDCRDVIVRHYQTSREWIMPFDVLTAVKRLRAKRLHDNPEPAPPPDMTPIETVAWLKDVRRRIANGEDVQSAGYGELEERHLPDLRRLIQRGPTLTTAPPPDLTPLPEKRDPAAVAARSAVTEETADE